MAQFARPDSTVTATEFSGGFAQIDEASPNDSDFCVTPDNTTGQLEVGLSTVTNPGVSTGHVLRYRLAKADTGVPPSTTGNTQNGTVTLRQGANLIAGRAESDLGEWTTFVLNLSEAQAGNITDYSDLRIRYDSPASGAGPGNNRRGGAISWAELEVPDAGGDTALAGSSDGSSTAVGDLTTSITLVAATDGSSTAVASLTTTITFVSSVAGVGTASGALTTQIALASAAAGTATAGATLTTEIRLVGESAGTGAASGTLPQAGDTALAGESAGAATAAGDLTTQISLVGASTGPATASGVLSTEITLAGATTGSSTAVGILTIPDDTSLAGDSAGSSTVVGALTTAIQLVSSVPGTSTAAAELTTQIALVGNSAASSSVIADLSTSIVLVGLSGGVAGVSAVLSVGEGADTSLIGSSAGVSSAVGIISSKVYRRSLAFLASAMVHLVDDDDLNGDSARAYYVTGASRVIVWVERSSGADAASGVDVLMVSHDNGVIWAVDETLMLATSNDRTGTKLGGLLNSAGVEPIGGASGSAGQFVTFYKAGPYAGPACLRIMRDPPWTGGAPSVHMLVIGGNHVGNAPQMVT